MPEYTYRREDGSTFTIKQKFTDSALTTDPTTGQKVWRIVQNAGVIFKGSGFYVNDSKGSSKSTLTSNNSGANGNASGDKPASTATADAPKSENTSTPSTASTPPAKD